MFQSGVDFNAEFGMKRKIWWVARKENVEIESIT